MPFLCYSLLILEAAASSCMCGLVAPALSLGAVTEFWGPGNYD